MRFCEQKSHARRLDIIPVERLKSCSMKLTRVRYFSHASIILICCCISIAFAASAAAAPFSVPDWIELSPNDPPPARSYLAMTYDPVSGKIIAFGGFDGTGYLNDTWSFDGTNWTQIATQSAPPARAAAQMTYDSVTQKVVLFGGFDGTNYLGDTWLWDGSTLQWTEATPDHHPSGCYRSDVVSRPEWQCRSFWRVRRPILSAYYVAMERLRLDAIIATDCSVCPGFSGRCNEYVHGTGCYVWRSR